MRNQKPVSREREFVAAKRRHRGWTKVMGVLACVVVFCTTYALILPAITLESDTHCGLVEHQHTEECYTQQLICGLEEQAEQDGQEPAQVHTHTEACYGEVETLVCDQPESESHTHSETCYDAEGNLTCGLEESEGHTHTAECYAVESVLTCGQEEGQPEAAQPHVHTEACYGPVLTCELEEHTHTDACYIDVTADLETAADWEATLPTELTGVWADDLLAVAKSQLGYTESTVNYTLTEDGSHKGYTRYGAWYGMPYEDWCAMFASFCLNYADIPAESMPRASACQSWIDTLSSESWNLYVAVERQEGSSDLTEDSYIPVPGDLVFFDFNGDGASDHVGIVAEYNEATLLKGTELKTIEGNSSSKVQYVTYDPADPAIMGYAMLPENLTTLTYAGTDYTVTVSYGPDAELPENVELSAAEYPKDSETYLARYAEAAALYGWAEEEDNTAAFRLFDIGLYADGQEIEPAAPVQVTVTYAGQASGRSYQVTHFGSQEAETVDAASAYADGSQTVDFALNSFSDVAIMPLDLNTTDLDGKTFALINASGSGNVAMMNKNNNSQPQQLAGEAVDWKFRKSTDDGFYYLYTTEDSQEEDLAKVTPYLFWTFERAGADNQYRIHTTVDGFERYLRIDSYKGPVIVTDEENASTFTVNAGTGDFAGKVRLTTTVDYNGSSATNAINLYGGTSTRGFGGWNDNSGNEYFYLVAGVKVPGTVQNTVSPNGTVINVFDYWTTDRWPAGGDYAQDSDGNKGKYTDLGINLNHTLKFGRGGAGPGRYGEPGTGIVNNVLVNNYPTLTSNSSESLAYLFDPDYAGVESGYRKTNRNVKGLLQLDDQGYYYFDSRENFAELDEDEDTKTFTLYDTWGVYAGGKSSNGQFFPFNTFAASGGSTSISSDINHYFGLTLTSRFVLRNDGFTTSAHKTPMEFEFSGDDDVWIFIDDVLVADLGGCHEAMNVKINFVTGEVKITDYNGDEAAASTTLYQAFNAAGKTDTVEWSEDTNNDGERATFANNTYHTLRFFYLERGSTDSNLYLRYNLTEIPVTSVNKVNQYGDAVPGAEFEVYASDADWKYDDKHPVYSGTTNAEGEMVFVDADNVPYSITDLKRMFGEYFVLKETKVPDGYRLVSDEIHLHIKNNVLLCENTFDSGVWSSATLLVDAPTELQLANNRMYENSNIIQYYDPEKETINGSLFAVVLKYTGPRDADGNATQENLADESNWAPVYGTQEDGFTVADTSNGIKEAAIFAAQRYTESQNVFEFSASGQMQGELVGMPGDISTYYYMLDDKSETQYTVAYYWTPERIENNDWTGVAAENTFLIESNNKEGSYAFARVFGATVQVPNLLNRLVVQKLDENGALVNGATFAMYSVTQGDDGTIYYTANDTDNTKIHLGAYDGEKGTATLIDGTTTGTYTMGADGVITVTIGSAKYTINPERTAETLAKENAANTVNEDGSASFVGMSEGYYIVREVVPPAGYKLNPNEIMVLVNDTAVYANAGTATDGITVGRGPGYMVATLDMFASNGQIDNTLSWVYEQMRVSDPDLSFKALEEAVANGEPEWEYLQSFTGHGFNADTRTTATQANALTTYLEYAKGENNALYNYAINADRYKAVGTDPATVNRRLYTSVGWSYYLLYQDYEWGDMHKTEGAVYEDLSDQEISNLFSRSTFVRVSDEFDRSLTIQKVDATAQTKTLQGAEFTLTRTVGTGNDAIVYNYVEDNGTGSWVLSTEGGPTPSTLTTDENGLINISASLLNGTYTLTETKAPDGYKLPSAPVTFTVASGEVKATDGYDVDEVKNVDGSIHYTLTVPNNSGIALPNTGGSGTWLYTTAGLLLMCGAVCLLYRRKRRGEEARRTTP